MHFWIDKRSQCAYTGRNRVPTSLSSGRARTRGARKGMAAPVHRFTAVATVECPPRRPPRSNSSHYPRSQSIPQVHARRQTEDNSLYVEIPPDPPQPTIASLAAARSVTPDTLLRTAALGLHQSPMMAPHLKFGMLVSFALATIFLAGAKYYFDRQVSRGTPGTSGAGGAGGEAGAVCALALAAAGAGCALSVCRARHSSPAPLLPPERVSSTALRHVQDTVLEETVVARGREPSVPTPSGATPPSPEAPPPYHIAVLLPPRDTASPPPPAYSALS